MKGQSREARSWGSPPPMHCEGPSFTHDLLMDGGTHIQGQRPQPPLAFWREFPENNLEPELGIQSQFSGLPVQLQPTKICPQPCQRPTRSPQLRTWNLGSETWQLWTAPTLEGQQGTLTMDGAPGPAQDRSHTGIGAGPEPAPRGIRTLTGPDPTWGLGLIWDPDSDVGNLTGQIQDYI